MGSRGPGRTGFPAEAFNAPEEPIARDASDPYISPDDPIPRRSPLGADLSEEGIDLDEVMVTGMGDDPHLAPEELGLTMDPTLAALSEQVAALADALRLQGELGLKEHPGMSAFESTLRAYCVGYLKGRRAEEGRA